MTRPKFGARLPTATRATEQKLAYFAWAFLLFFLFDIKGFVGRSLYRVADLANINYSAWSRSSWPAGSYWSADGISHITNLRLEHAERSLPGGNPDCRDRTGYGPYKAPDKQVREFIDELWRKANNPRVDSEPEMEFEDFIEQMEQTAYLANMLPAEEMTAEDKALSREEWLDKYGHPDEIFQYHIEQGTFLEAVEKVFPNPRKGSPQESYKAMLLRAAQRGYSKEDLTVMTSEADRFLGTYDGVE